MNCFNPCRQDPTSQKKTWIHLHRTCVRLDLKRLVGFWNIFIYIYVVSQRSPTPCIQHAAKSNPKMSLSKNRVTHVILWLITIFLLEMLNARYHFQVLIKLSRPETPNSVGEWEFNVSNTSNISYETKRDEYEARRFRICSSRNGLRQRKQLVCVESSTRSWCEDIKRNGTKSSKEKHSRKMKRRDLRTRTSQEHPKELLHMQREGRAASRS